MLLTLNPSAKLLCFWLIFNSKIILCRHAGQLKVMFVGGPNERKDYHIEEGEEVKLNCLVYACAYLGQLVRVYHTVFLLH